MGLGLGELAGLLPGEAEEKGGGAVFGMGGEVPLIKRRGFGEALLLVKLERLLFGGLSEKNDGQERGSDTHGTILRRCGGWSRLVICDILDRNKGDWFWLI